MKTVTKSTVSTAKANNDGTKPGQQNRAGFNRNQLGMEHHSSAAYHLLGTREADLTLACAEFRDKGVGRAANQTRSTEERTADRPRGGRGARGRGGKTQPRREDCVENPHTDVLATGAGATRHRNADDRHAKNLAPYVSYSATSLPISVVHSANRPHSGSEKQAAQSWGANDGDAELKDEQAGDAIAQTEKRDAEAEDAEAEAKEPEPKQVTLDAYYAERDNSINEGLKIRKVEDVPEGVQVQKDEAEDYFAGTGGKAKKAKSKKVKETIAWEDSGREERDTRGGRGGGSRGDRGPRGDGSRGGRGGGPRGGRGDGGFPPRGAPRGGAPRGGRGGAAAPNLSNPDDFPSLG